MAWTFRIDATQGFPFILENEPEPGAIPGVDLENLSPPEPTPAAYARLLDVIRTRLTPPGLSVHLSSVGGGPSLRGQRYLGYNRRGETISPVTPPPVYIAREPFCISELRTFVQQIHTEQITSNTLPSRTDPGYFSVGAPLSLYTGLNRSQRDSLDSLLEKIRGEIATATTQNERRILVSQLLALRNTAWLHHEIQDSLTQILTKMPQAAATVVDLEIQEMKDGRRVAFTSESYEIVMRILADPVDPSQSTGLVLQLSEVLDQAKNNLSLHFHITHVLRRADIRVPLRRLLDQRDSGSAPETALLILIDPAIGNTYAQEIVEDAYRANAGVNPIVRRFWDSIRDPDTDRARYYEALNHLSYFAGLGDVDAKILLAKIDFTSLPHTAALTPEEQRITIEAALIAASTESENAEEYLKIVNPFQNNQNRNFLPASVILELCHRDNLNALSFLPLQTMTSIDAIEDTAIRRQLVTKATEVLQEQAVATTIDQAEAQLELVGNELCSVIDNAYQRQGGFRAHPETSRAIALWTLSYMTAREAPFRAFDSVQTVNAAPVRTATEITRINTLLNLFRQNETPEPVRRGLRTALFLFNPLEHDPSRRLRSPEANLFFSSLEEAQIERDFGRFQRVLQNPHFSDSNFETRREAFIEYTLRIASIIQDPTTYETTRRILQTGLRNILCEGVLRQIFLGNNGRTLSYDLRAGAALALLADPAIANPDALRLLRDLSGTQMYSDHSDPSSPMPIQGAVYFQRQLDRLRSVLPSNGSSYYLFLNQLTFLARSGFFPPAAAILRDMDFSSFENATTEPGELPTEEIRIEILVEAAEVALRLDNTSAQAYLRATNFFRPDKDYRSVSLRFLERLSGVYGNESARRLLTSFESASEPWSTFRGQASFDRPRTLGQDGLRSDDNPRGRAPRRHEGIWDHFRNHMGRGRY